MLLSVSLKISSLELESIVNSIGRTGLLKMRAWRPTPVDQQYRCHSASKMRSVCDSKHRCNLRSEFSGPKSEVKATTQWFRANFNIFVTIPHDSGRSRLSTSTNTRCGVQSSLVCWTLKSVFTPRSILIIQSHFMICDSI